MKRNVVAIAVCLGLGVAAGTAFAGSPQSTEPTQTEVHKEALKNGPATPQIDYPTQKNSVPAYQGEGSAQSKPVPPLTQREMGMLYNACIAYPECKTAYADAKEHEAELERAKKAKAGGGGGQ